MFVLFPVILETLMYTYATLCSMAVFMKWEILQLFLTLRIWRSDILILLHTACTYRKPTGKSLIKLCWRNENILVTQMWKEKLQSFLFWQHHREGFIEREALQREGEKKGGGIRYFHCIFQLKKSVPPLHFSKYHSYCCVNIKLQTPL